MGSLDKMRVGWASPRARRARPGVTPTSGTLSTLRVEEHLDLACSADDAMAFIADPANNPLLSGHPTELGFTLPGSPVGQVGERQCILRTQLDGTISGKVREVVELLPGWKLTTRSISSEPFPKTRRFIALPLGASTCRLSYERSIELSIPAPPWLAPGMSAAIQATLGHVAHHVAGAADVGRSPKVAVAEREEYARRLAAILARLRPASVSVTMDLRASHELAWALLIDARNDRLGSAHPDDTATFSVPGTPTGAVGELRCKMLGVSSSKPQGIVHEVVALDPGREFTVRNRSMPYTELTTVQVEPAGTGSRVTVHSETFTHCADGPFRSANEGAIRARLTAIDLLADGVSARSGPLADGPARPTS